MVKKSTKQLTLDQAYQAAYLWLDYVGDPPIEISEPAHGSVELITERAFVRVRSSEAPVEQSSVLALLRAAEPGKKLVIFSPSGFSAGALSIAETQGIALFTLDPTGTAVAETTHARVMQPAILPDPPFVPLPKSSKDDFWDDLTSRTPHPKPEDAAAIPGIDAATTDWADCPQCGATHYRNAKFCRECGTSLQDARHDSPVSSVVEPQGPEAPRSTTGTKLRCRTCGSHDIELIT